MDGHQANDVGGFGAGGGEWFFWRLGDELGELRDVFVEIVVVAVGGASVFDELLQIGEFAFAEEFGEEDGVVAGEIEGGV